MALPTLSDSLKVFENEIDSININDSLESVKELYSIVTGLADCSQLGNVINFRSRNPVYKTFLLDNFPRLYACSEFIVHILVFRSTSRTYFL